jgi:hypothetical protein
VVFAVDVAPGIPSPFYFLYLSWCFFFSRPFLVYLSLATFFVSSFYLSLSLSFASSLDLSVYLSFLRFIFLSLSLSISLVSSFSLSLFLYLALLLPVCASISSSAEYPYIQFCYNCFGSPKDNVLQTTDESVPFVMWMSQLLIRLERRKRSYFTLMMSSRHEGSLCHPFWCFHLFSLCRKREQRANSLRQSRNKKIHGNIAI